MAPSPSLSSLNLSRACCAVLRVEQCAPARAGRTMGKSKDKWWDCFKKEADGSGWRDIYTNELHKGSNITKLKLWLAFHCPKFKEENAVLRDELLCSFTTDNVAGCAAKHKEEVARAKAAFARRQAAALGGSGPQPPSGTDSSTLDLARRYGAAGASVFVSGFSAARLALEKKGYRFMDSHVDTMSKAELEAAKMLQARWMLCKGMPLNACDGIEFNDFVRALRPAAAGKLYTESKLRCENDKCLLTSVPALTRAPCRARSLSHGDVVDVTYFLEKRSWRSVPKCYPPRRATQCWRSTTWWLAPARATARRMMFSVPTLSCSWRLTQ